MTDLRDGIDSLKRQNDAQRPGESEFMQYHEQALAAMGFAQLREQGEENDFDEEMEEASGTEEEIVAEEQHKGAEVERAKHRPEPAGAESGMESNTSALPVRSV